MPGGEQWTCTWPQRPIRASKRSLASGTPIAPFQAQSTELRAKSSPKCGFARLIHSSTLILTITRARTHPRFVRYALPPAVCPSRTAAPREGAATHAHSCLHVMIGTANLFKANLCIFPRQCFGDCAFRPLANHFPSAKCPASRVQSKRYTQLI